MKKPITVTEIEHMVFRLAQEKLEFNEPIPDFGTRFPNSLESCLATPLQTFSGRDLYPSLFDKAAILSYFI